MRQPRLLGTVFSEVSYNSTRYSTGIDISTVDGLWRRVNALTDKERGDETLSGPGFKG